MVQAKRESSQSKKTAQTNDSPGKKTDDIPTQHNAKRSPGKSNRHDKPAITSAKSSDNFSQIQR
jgi:hypothetical protein